MKLEQQAVSLELAREMNKLRLIPRPSTFSWAKGEGEAEYHLVFGDCNQIPTVTVAELGKMLPENTETHRYNNEYNVRYFDKFEAKRLVYSLWGETEANARAKMLIWLSENGYLETDDGKKVIFNPPVELEGGKAYGVDFNNECIRPLTDNGKG